MKIYGLQKMTLLDFPGHVACTVFLGGCDLRCPFCHNYDLACTRTPVLMESDEFLRFLSKRKGLLDGVAVTGGEPCLHRDLPEFLRQIREEGFLTKLDTNGLHPDILGRIIQDHLTDYTAMDVKNSPQKYALTCGIPEDALDLNKIRESIAILLGGETDYEFRTTVVNEFHEEADLEQIGRMIQGAKAYFLQSFTDREEVPFAGLHAPSKDRMLRYEALVKPYVQQVSIRGMDL